MEVKYKKYIDTKTDFDSWDIYKTPKKSNYNYIVSIPCYDEYDYIFQTLESINKQSRLLDDALVSIVVNNSDEEQSKRVIKNNDKTYKKLVDTSYNFDMMLIDAYSNGRAIPEKEAGVGMARKISVDMSLHFSSNDSVICFIDADSILDEHYLKTISHSQIKNKWHGATVNFSHLKDDPKTIKLIEDYEYFLKYNSSKMKECGSPYYHIPLGSTMVCRTSAYVSVGGMNKKKAAEDFYFLQDLQKFRDIYSIEDILIHPSSRSSDRCYLGTSTRMKKCLDGDLNIPDLHYSEESYKILRSWIGVALKSKNNTSSDVLEQCKEIHEGLPEFLIQYNFKKAWDGIIEAPSDNHFTMQFHRWFDAFKTFKLLKIFS